MRRHKSSPVCTGPAAVCSFLKRTWSNVMTQALGIAYWPWSFWTLTTQTEMDSGKWGSCVKVLVSHPLIHKDIRNYRVLAGLRKSVTNWERTTVILVPEGNMLVFRAALPWFPRNLHLKEPSSCHSALVLSTDALTRRVFLLFIWAAYSGHLQVGKRIRSQLSWTLKHRSDSNRKF